MIKKRYALNQSPLYKLKRPDRLAELLFLSRQELEALANPTANLYNCFELPSKTPGKKGRWIEWPKRILQSVQRRLGRLLDKITPPEYIHSGFSGRSYVTNAKKHDISVRLVKIDIRKFFPSSSARYVLGCFIETFACSPDVAMILTKLTTFGGHLPTGGSTSPILSFYAYKPMFDTIHSMARERNLVMSCCVDDMTFSGEAATRGFLNEIRIVVSKYGLKTHKYHCFEPKQVKIVTGVAITPKGIRLPNKRRRKLDMSLADFNNEPDLKKKVKLGEQMLGRATEAAQIEEKFEALIIPTTRRLNDAKRSLNSE